MAAAVAAVVAALLADAVIGCPVCAWFLPLCSGLAQLAEQPEQNGHHTAALGTKWEPLPPTLFLVKSAGSIDKLIVPVNADDFSLQAVDNMFNR